MTHLPLYNVNTSRICVALLSLLSMSESYLKMWSYVQCTGLFNPSVKFKAPLITLLEEPLNVEVSAIISDCLVSLVQILGEVAVELRTRIEEVEGEAQLR